MKSLLYILTGAMIAIATSGCMQDSFVPAETKMSDVKIAIDTSYVSIVIDSMRLFSYKIFSVTNDGIFCGYNSKTKALDLYVLPERKVLKSIPLNASDSHVSNIEHIRSIKLKTIDSIFVLSSKQVTLYNAHGALSHIDINNGAGFFYSHYFLEFEESNFTFRNRDKKLYVTTVSPSGDVLNSLYWRTPFITSFTIDERSNMQQLNGISYSTLYSKAYYGFLTAPQFSFSKDEISVIYNFPIDPNIYVYNLVTHKTTGYGGVISSTVDERDNVAQALSPKNRSNSDKKMLHFLENIYYHKVLTDYSGNFFYRFHELPIVYDHQPKGRLPEKKKFLSVFDESFNLITTLDLNDHPYDITRAFTTRQGLLVPEAKGSSSLRFKVFKFRKK